MNITVGMKLFRNQYYIEYVLKAIYNFATKIVIAHGPVKAMTVWKQDNTLKLIREFPDPDKKITVLAKDSWENITQMVNATYALAEGLYFKLDGDEIISPELQEEIKNNLSYCTAPNRPIILGNIHFLRSFKQHVVKSTIDPWRLRIFMYSKKHRFNHPDFVPGVFTKPTDPGRRLKNPIYHYPYVLPGYEALIKLTYHWMHWKKYNLHDAIKVAKDRMNKLRTNTFSWTIKDWKGQHPTIMQDHPFINKTFNWIINDHLWVKELR